MESIADLNSMVWNCAVCSQPFQDIMILPCQHKFCARCLKVWVGVYIDSYRSGQQEFPCRLCWQLFHVPQTGGLDAFRHSHDVHDLGLDFSHMTMDTDDGESRNAQISNSVSPFVHANLSNKQQYGLQSVIGNGADIQQNPTQNEHNGNVTAVDTTSRDGQRPTRVHLSNSAPEFSNLPISSPDQCAMAPVQNCDTSTEAAMEDASPGAAPEKHTGHFGDLPMSFQDQNAYGQRLCFPSCHTYMYHLV